MKTENLQICRFCHSGRPQNENKRNRKEIQILGLCQGTEKAVEREGQGNIDCIGAIGMVSSNM